ncbi:MAG: DNA polymerase I [Clostridia bacterium]|nr:DNA polymerase I [Clostridia bacterium]
MDTLVIIDGNSLVNRAFYALPPMLNDGKPTQAVYGFASMLIRMIGSYHPDFVAVAFDLPAPTFRHKRYDGYKANRKHMPDDLAVQMPLLKDMLRAMDVRIIEQEGYEADDIIGTLAANSKILTYIVTGDRDSLQLINATTKVVLTKRGITDVLELDEEGLMREFSLTPSQIIEYKAIAGDSSDCIPGVGGIGDKGAMQLLKDYESLDGIYAHIDEIPTRLKNKLEQFKQQAYLSKELATIVTDAPIDCSLDLCRFSYPFSHKVKRFFIDVGFKSLVKRDELFDLSDDTGDTAPTVAPPPEVREITSAQDLSEILQSAFVTKKLAVEIGGESASIAFDCEREYRIPLLRRLDCFGMSLGEFLDCLKNVLADSGVSKIVYDSKKFKKSMRSVNIPCRGFTDVKLARYCVDVTEANETAADVFAAYSLDPAYPAAGLVRAAQLLETQIQSGELEKVYYGLELPLVDVLTDMEEVGFKVDLKRLNEFSVEFTAQRAKLTEEIYALGGVEFNINSPKQLAKVLFEDLKIPYPRKGGISTNADVLQQISGEHPIVEKILAYRSVAKLNSTYIDGLRKLTDDKGVIRTEFRQTSTATGRLSSVEPNLQNIPVREERGKALRALFVAREGHTLISADYSQIELRLLAHMSGDETLISAYYAGDDVHTLTASKVFGVPAENVTPKMRREAKAVNFGIIYGISDFGLSQNINISRAGAKKYIDEYFLRFPTVAKYLDESVRLAKERGYAVTIMGRRRKIPELFSSQFNTRQFGERVAMNMPLQGSAADIIKAAMISVHERLKDMKSKLILQIHDELIVEAADDETELVREILRDCMENAVKLKVPLTVDIGSGKSWIDC